MRGNPVRKRKAYKMRIMKQNSAVEGCHELPVKAHKDLEVLLLQTPILLARLTLLEINDTLLGWKQIYMNGKCFLLTVM